jgi:hypothetical protein
MRMKYLFLIHLFFYLINLNLFAEDNSILLSLKKMQLSLDKNNFENVETIYDDNEKELSQNWMALEKLALSFERRNKYKEATEVYKKLIVQFNLPAHKLIISAPPGSLAENIYQTNKLPYYYYKMAYLNAQLYIKSNRFTPENDRAKFKNNVNAYIAVLKKVKADEAELKIVTDLITEKIVEENQLTYKSGRYIFSNIISWQDRIQLKENSSGSTSALSSTALGTSIGIGTKWGNSRYEFNIEGMYTIANSTISNENGIDYLQSSVPVTSYIVGPGIYYKGYSDKVMLGIQFPMSYRTGSWQAPEGYSFEDAKQFGAGYFFQVKMLISSISIQTRLGKIFPNPGSHWSIGVQYDF